MTETAPRPACKQYRIYHAQYLLEDGGLASVERRLTATALFEQACAAMARGTVIDTPNGPTAIEDIIPGQLIQSIEGPAKVLWIGSTVMLPGAQHLTHSILTRLIRVQTTALRAAVMGDLILGPLARIAHTPQDALRKDDFGWVAPIDAFGGDFAFPLTPPGPVQMFQVKVERSAPVSAHGLWVETLRNPTRQNSFADDWSLLAQLYVPAAARQVPGLARSTR